MVSVSMQGKYGLVAIDDLSQAATAQVRKDFRWLSAYRVHDRGIVSDHHPLLGAQHGKRTLQLQSLIDRGLNKALQLRLAKRSEYAASKASEKSFGAGEADPIALVSAAIEDLDAFSRRHFHQLFGLATLIVMISQHSHNGDA